MKFITLLREPVARDYSWFQQVTRARLAGGEFFEDQKTFEEMDADQSPATNHIKRSGE